ncbi:PLP-dependent transferase [Atractiella rhizophila]|nr:PLP-dependent transferase [Atractiella rhizophila]
MLSERGLKDQAIGKESIVLGKLKQGNQYSTDNPNGIINLGVASNVLMIDELGKFARENLNLIYTDYTYSDAPTSSLRLNRSFAAFFTQYFNAREPVTNDHIVWTTGVGNALDELAWVLANPGDLIMMSRPYYNGFVLDLVARSQVDILGVKLPVDVHPGAPETLQYFDKALDTLDDSTRRKVKMIMLVNPHNPLGFTYPKETILEYCRFAEKQDLQLIVDEIYALSLYDTPDVPDPTPFTSILSIDILAEAKCNPSRVHMIYGPSKDFGANGFRLGVVVSQHNHDVIEALCGVSVVGRPSSVPDAIFSALFTSTYLTEYITLNRQRLSRARAFVASRLTQLGIPYYKSNAGLFLWIDLRRWMREGGEMELRDKMAANGVYVTPGNTYGGTIKGFFRLTFSLLPEYTKVGLDRIETALNEI